MQPYKHYFILLIGMLAAESSWIAFNDTRFTGFAMTIGIVGEYSFAEDV